MAGKPTFIVGHFQLKSLIRMAQLNINEMKTTVSQALEVQGVLSKIRVRIPILAPSLTAEQAQLRASVYTVIDEQERTSGNILENRTIKRIQETGEGTQLLDSRNSQQCRKTSDRIGTRISRILRIRFNSFSVCARSQFGMFSSHAQCSGEFSPINIRSQLSNAESVCLCECISVCSSHFCSPHHTLEGVLWRGR